MKSGPCRDFHGRVSFATPHLNFKKPDLTRSLPNNVKPQNGGLRLLYYDLTSRSAVIA